MMTLLRNPAMKVFKLRWIRPWSESGATVMAPTPQWAIELVVPDLQSLHPDACEEVVDMGECSLYGGTGMVLDYWSIENPSYEG